MTKNDSRYTHTFRILACSISLPCKIFSLLIQWFSDMVHSYLSRRQGLWKTFLILFLPFVIRKVGDFTVTHHSANFFPTNSIWSQFRKREKRSMECFSKSSSQRYYLKQSFQQRNDDWIRKLERLVREARIWFIKMSILKEQLPGIPSDEKRVVFIASGKSRLKTIISLFAVAFILAKVCCIFFLKWFPQLLSLSICNCLFEFNSHANWTNNFGLSFSFLFQILLLL